MNTKISSFKVPLATWMQKPDRVIVSLLFGLAALFALNSTQGMRSVHFVIDALFYIAPFLLLAVCIAASIRASGADQLVVKVFSGHPLKTVFVASLFGALSPFCSCGVIPLIATMLVAGVPLAPVMAFWVASPIMDPEMFILTSAGISVEFALAKTLFAITLGLLAGISVLLIKKMGGLENILKAELGSTGCATACGSNAQTPILWSFWKSKARINLFIEEFKQTAYFLGKWLTLAFFLESLMVAYIEPQWVQQYVSGDSVFVLPLAALIGMPSYLNGYAAIPLVGGLIDMGMSQGAAMAFMLAGAVSSIPAAIAVYALVKIRVFALYLAIGLVGSILCGFAFSIFLA
jgi:uncharacterized membrane protein YraQ (UPF0718 family)